MAIKPIDHYSMTTPASVYDEEALTALELAGRTAAKVNETVEAFNTLEKNTGDHLAAQDKEIADRTAAQDKEIADRTAAQDAAIPKKVEAAVDDHIASGAFDAKINLYAGDLENRLDNLVGNVSAGSTTMDAEIIDARTGISGNPYANLREAIHGEIERSVNDTGLYDDTNRFNPSTVVMGHYINTDGKTLLANPSHNASDYIRVRPSEKIHFAYDGYETMASFVYFYDETKNKIGDHYTYVTEAIAPAGAYFMRVCHAVTNVPDATLFMVTKPYFGYKTIKYGERFNYAPDHGDIYAVVYGNRFNPAKYKYNAYVAFDDGRTIRNETPAAYITTDLIPILEGETLKMCDKNMNKRSIRMVAGYDKNFNFVSGAENVETYTQSGDIKYVRFAVRTENLNDTIICADDQRVYTEYGHYIVKQTGEIGEQLESMIGGSNMRVTGESLASGGQIALTAFPYYLKNNHAISFTGRFTAFSSLTIGRGKHDSSYGSLWFEITPTSVTAYGKRASVETYETVNHGLTISSFITVIITYTDNKPTITIITVGGTFKHTHNFFGRDCGQIFAEVGQATSDVTISASCGDFNKPLWLVGDSYFGFTNDRVVGALRNFGFSNYLTIGMSGLNSKNALDDVNRALAYGTPKYILWYLGMNDGATDAGYTPYLDQLKAICVDKNITLIINRVPTIPTISKEAISSAVINSGLRYIDSYAAVGADSSGTWIAGTLSSDGVHPTESGANILAARMLVDVPEIMSYGKE